MLDEARIIDGRQQTVCKALAIEREHLQPLPNEGFDLVEVSFAKIDGLRRVRVRTNEALEVLQAEFTLEKHGQLRILLVLPTTADISLHTNVRHASA